MEVKEIIELMKAVSDNGLTAFKLEQGDTKLVMKREKIVAVSGGNPVVVPAAGAAAGSLDGGSGDFAGIVEAEPVKSGSMGTAVPDQVITCPLVGTFYSAPSPDAEDFVKIGDHVKKGQVVGIVEAMKLMNEIESEFDGIIEAVMVKNEDIVEYGQPLFRIR